MYTPTAALPFAMTSGAAAHRRCSQRIADGVGARAPQTEAALRTISGSLNSTNANRDGCDGSFPFSCTFVTLPQFPNTTRSSPSVVSGRRFPTYTVLVAPAFAFISADARAGSRGCARGRQTTRSPVVSLTLARVPDVLHSRANLLGDRVGAVARGQPPRGACALRCSRRGVKLTKKESMGSSKDGFDDVMMFDDD